MERLRLLLTPSLSSSTACLGFAALLLGTAAWSYIDDNKLFYDYIFGSYGFKTTLLQAPEKLWSLGNSVAGSSVTYYILVGLCGLLAGLTTFTIMETIGHLRKNTSEVIENMHHTGNAYRQAVRESFMRLALRTVSLVFSAIYLIIFATILMPYSVYWLQNGIDELQKRGIVGWLIILGSWLFFSLALHVIVIFARLVWLRPRLFGNSDLEEGGLE